MDNALAKLSQDSARQVYLQSYSPGQKLFREGDDQHDLFILVSGQLDVLKGDKIISTISEPGSIFGEMAFLLEAKRTATIKARTKAQAYGIPREDLDVFFKDYPEVSQHLSKVLAQRLDESSHALYGLKEFADQLPEAVILTNQKGNIVTWNAAAREVYGRTWHQVAHRQAAEIYENPSAYKEMLEELQGVDRLTGKMLSLEHPQKGKRFISLSLTKLFDDYKEFQGVLTLAWDVTTSHQLKQRYRRLLSWLTGLLTLLFTLMVLATYFDIPLPFSSIQVIDAKKQAFSAGMRKDFLLLKSLLKEEIEQNDREQINRLLAKFLKSQGGASGPYSGVVLLDAQKNVIDSYSLTAGEKTGQSAGVTYAHIDLTPHHKSNHRVLTLYRAEPSGGGSRRQLEVAFELNKEGAILGWVVFQMNEKVLADKNGIGIADLEKFRFSTP